VPRSSTSAKPTACFVSASGQNVFFEELLEAIRNALAHHGITTEVAVDHFPSPRAELVYVFVPHEYLPLTMSSAHPTNEQLRRSVVIATEQPGTQWFEGSAAVAERAAATVDIHELGVAELRRRGVEARHLQLGYVDAWDHWHGRAQDRPVDLTFLGGYTPRRALALARCGRSLQQHAASVRLVETWRPHQAADDFFLSGRGKYRHLARTKVLLSVHRDPTPYLEWARVLEASMNGCVVLTEHSSGVSPLVPGVHFASASYENLPVALEALLDDEGRLGALRTAAYDFVRKEMPLTRSVTVLAEAIDEVAQAPIVFDGAKRRPAPAPKAPLEPDPEWQQLLAEPTDDDRLRSTVKQLLMAQRRLERRVDALLDPADHRPDEIVTFGPYKEAKPAVTVALTVFNYADVVEEALRSVSLSTFRDLELVVVDDASTDESRTVIEHTLRELPWLPARLVARGENGGLPAARNLAIAEGRGEYVFILDADNAVYPHALERLVTALRENRDAAFAYGIAEKFNAIGPTDLISWRAWSVDRFRYGNYIDAMALIRRTALEQVGGFTCDGRLYGWEDFALWCAFAQAGLYGVLVPEILARYRLSPDSMIKITNLETSEPWAVLIEQFPFLLGEDDGAVT
jgi:Glycosyl transferase family 2